MRVNTGLPLNPGGFLVLGTKKHGKTLQSQSQSQSHLLTNQHLLTQPPGC